MQPLLRIEINLEREKMLSPQGDRAFPRRKPRERTEGEKESRREREQGETGERMLLQNLGSS